MAYRFLIEIDDDRAAELGFREEAGWANGFTRAHALGAWPNGSRVAIINAAVGQSIPNGTTGTVLGSMTIAGIMTGGDVSGFLYFIEFDSHPRRAIGVASVTFGMPRLALL